MRTFFLTLAVIGTAMVAIGLVRYAFEGATALEYFHSDGDSFNPTLGGFLSQFGVFSLVCWLCGAMVSGCERRRSKRIWTTV